MGRSLHRNVVILAAALGLGLTGAGSVGAADPTLSIQYIGCNSMRLTPSPVPAGTYQVLVYDDDNCKAGFSLSGPGVNMAGNDLDSSGMGIDHPAGPFGPFTFQAGSSYTARDSVQGISVAFTATQGGGSSNTSTTPSNTSTTSNSSKATTSTAVKTLGTLAGSVGATGKASLKIGGSTVKKLKA